MVQCINGCMTRPKDDSEPRPREATCGLLCDRDATKLTGWLTDIPLDYALLPLLTVPSVSVAPGESLGGNFAESPAPVRLDVVALTDGDRITGARDPGDELWWEGNPDIPATLPVVTAWASQLRADLDPSRDPGDRDPAATVVSECRYLLAAFDSLTAAPWVDEAYAELKRLASALRGAHGLNKAATPMVLCECYLTRHDGTACTGRIRDAVGHGYPTCDGCNSMWITMVQQAHLSYVVSQQQARAR